MKTHIRLMTAVFLFSAFSFGVFAVETKYSLRYRFEKGQVLRWNVQQSLKIETRIQGTKDVAETLSRSTKIWTVLDVDADGTATLEYKVGDVKMQRSQTNREDEKYDSLVDKKIPLAFQSIDGTIGVPLAHLTIGVHGETKKPKRVITAYSAADSGENRITIPLPQEPIGVGESWSVDIPVELPEPGGTVKKIAVRQKYTLESVKTGIAKIKFVTQILTPVDAKLESQLIDKFSEGWFEFDIDAGRLISQQSTIDKSIVGFHGGASFVHHQSRLSECCCGLKSCELCSKR